MKLVNVHQFIIMVVAIFFFCMTNSAFLFALSSGILLIGYVAGMYKIVPPQGSILKEVSGCIGVSKLFACFLFFALIYITLGAILQL